MLLISNISVACMGNPILHKISLSCAPGSIHALMGPNGSGKSTFAHLIAGHPAYSLVEGTVHFNDDDIISLSSEERARKGLCVVFQHLPSIPGLPMMTFLRESYRACTGKELDPATFEEEVRKYAALLGLQPSLLDRDFYDGFSGGEKKRCELLQLLVLKPRVIILDEIDSGLDINALSLVAFVVAQLKEYNPGLIVIIITHYNRLLSLIRPDHVHILSQGNIVRSGDAVLSEMIEQKGYQWIQ